MFFGKKRLLLPRFLFAIDCKYTNIVPNIKIFCVIKMSNILYPLKFTPVYKTKIWGGNRFEKLFNRKNTPRHCGESWEISDVEGSVSVVSNGVLKGNSLEELLEIFMGDLVGDSVYEVFGNRFPLLVKFIDAADDLSVQVHPDDDIAFERHNLQGKTEMWYVMDGDKDSELICGFNRELKKDEYIKAVDNHSIKDLLNYVGAKKGDVFFIPSGCVHAVGKGLLLMEIQQTSDVTYRIFDYNRKDENGNLRELHTDLAADALDFNYFNNKKIDYTPQKNAPVNVIDCKYFTTNVFALDIPVERDFPEIDSFIIYICVEGRCRIEYGDLGESVEITFGETVLVPAAIKNLRFYPDGNTRLIEAYIKENNHI